MIDMNKILAQLEEDIGWMRRMVKLWQYPPICFDGLLRVDRHHESNKQNQYTKVLAFRNQNSETYTDRYDTKEANYIH